ncbi:MAG: hypothetical protein AB7G76_13360 [Steroidobacteraceae bacterium]
MFNRSARRVAGSRATAPSSLAVRESVLAGFASEGLIVPARPAALEALLRGDAGDTAVHDIADSLFTVIGRDREAALLRDGALVTRDKALALSQLLPVSRGTVGAAALLHRAGEACALRALALAESGAQVRLDAPSRAELCARHQGEYTEQLVRDWALPAPVVEVLRTWRQFRPTVSLAAAVVYYAHFLASEQLHPEFFVPGLLRGVAAELGIDPARLPSG